MDVTSLFYFIFFPIKVLEAMHQKSGSKIPTGVVIANEVDLGRCKKLSGNMKLINSPILAVTAYNGQYFPDLKVKVAVILSLVNVKQYFILNGRFYCD